MSFHAEGIESEVWIVILGVNYGCYKVKRELGIKRRNKMNKKFINGTGIVFALALICSLFVNSIYASASVCYKSNYVSSWCSLCDANTYSDTQRDSCAGKHCRQNGVKFCSTHKNGISKEANYYKRGFSDYNCLAYALGDNSPGAWEWPTSWGESGPTTATFKKYIKAKGYTYTTNYNELSGKNVIYVYGKNGYVQHFARKYTLDGKAVSGANTISKWGAGCLYSTSSVTPYEDGCIYGSLMMYCYK